MSKVVIVAPNKRVADLVAKQHDMRPWDWRYAFEPSRLRGLTPKDTVFLHSGWEGAWLDEGFIHEMRLLRNIGVQIVMVTT